MNQSAFAAQSLNLARSRHPGGLAAVLRYVVLAFRIRRERDQLAAMTDAQLRDIGVSRADADSEAARELFDVPRHRKPGLDL